MLSTASLTVLQGRVTIILRYLIWLYNAIELSVVVIISIIVADASIPRQFVWGCAQVAEGLMALLAAAFALDSRYDRPWRHLLLLFDPALVIFLIQVASRRQSLLAGLEVAGPGRSRPMVEVEVMRAAALLHLSLYLLSVFRIN